jgi:type IV pilus assembly protein PilC
VALSIPGIRQLVLQSELTAYARTLGVLLQSGVTILKALELAAKAVSNEVIKTKLQGLEILVGQGQSFSDALRVRHLFPESAVSLIWIGESTGGLDRSLQVLGDISEKAVDRQSKVITVLLEPLIIITVGCILATLIVALLLPIFNMSLLVQ